MTSQILSPAPDPILENWQSLRAILPADLDDRARQFQFVRRQRGVTDTEIWLRMFLLHVAGGWSLKDTAAMGQDLGLAKVSGVALFKRLRQAEAWLGDLCQNVLAEKHPWWGDPAWAAELPVRVCGAVEVREAGRTGSDWRVHYGFRLPDFQADYYGVGKVGEPTGGLDRSFAPGELVAPLPGAMDAADLAQVVADGAAFLAPWQADLFPLSDAVGAGGNWAAELDNVEPGEVAEWPVTLVAEGTEVAGRLCAATGSEAVRSRSNGGRRTATRAGRGTEATLVVTSLPANRYNTEQVLQIHRDLVHSQGIFHQLNHWLRQGRVVKQGDAAARGWLQAKLLAALLLPSGDVSGLLATPPAAVDPYRRGALPQPPVSRR